MQVIVVLNKQRHIVKYIHIVRLELMSCRKWALRQQQHAELMEDRGFGEDAIKLLKRIAEKIPASRRGTRETRDFKKLMMAKLSITLMRGNLRLLSHFKDNFEPQGQV